MKLTLDLTPAQFEALAEGIDKEVIEREDAVNLHAPGAGALPRLAAARTAQDKLWDARNKKKR